MRRIDPLMECAIAFASEVLATPGTSSMRMCPSASRHTTASRTVCVFPWMKCSTLRIRSSQRRCTHRVWSAKPASNAMKPPGSTGDWCHRLPVSRLSEPTARSGAKLGQKGPRGGGLVAFSLGVDIGTTYTGAAVWRDGAVHSAPLGNRSHAVPSVLFLRDDDTLLVGEAATRRAVA